MILRPPVEAEVPAIHDLMTGIQQADGLPMIASVDEVAEFFSSPDIEPGLDLRVAEVDGTLVGYAIVDHSPSGERLERAVLFGGVDPAHRRLGIGRQLLEWQAVRAAEQLAKTSPTLPAHLINYVYDFEQSRLAFFEAQGFERARFDHELMRPLIGLPATADPDGITVRPWGDDDNEPARLVFNASFADHWGSTARSSEYWEHMLESAGNRLDLSFVAVDDQTGEAVALSLNGHYPDDRLVTGRLDGWIQTLGTLRSHRKRGIASALIVHSLHAFAGAGLDHAMLGVDTENPTGAYGIYADLGFERQHTVVTLLKTVREGTSG